MFSQKQGGVTSEEDLESQAVYVMHGLNSAGGLREEGFSKVIQSAIKYRNNYDLASIEVVWWADWMRFGKIGFELKTGHKS